MIVRFVVIKVYDLSKIQYKSVQQFTLFFFGKHFGEWIE